MPDTARAPTTHTSRDHDIVRRVGAPAGAPVRLSIPSLGIEAPVVPITLRGSTLTPPDDPALVGWWQDGAMPGARRGAALLTGHTVHTGGGAMDDLEQLRVGAPVVVRTTRGELRYAVADVRVVSKETLAAEAAELFSRTSAGQLVLVTCENWNGTTYDSNVVVEAVER